MSSPFLAEIRIWGCGYAPSGWAQCNGQILPISQYTALFSLLGTWYGGNGTSNFALPNLQGAVPVSQGQGPGLLPYSVGDYDGVSAETLSVPQVAQHTHGLNAFQGRGPQPHTSPLPGDSLTSTVGTYPMYNLPSAGLNILMSPQTSGPTGGGLPHENRMPSLGLNYCIALQGVYPQRS